jgi:hypothetical protein
VAALLFGVGFLQFDQVALADVSSVSVSQVGST